MKKNIFVLVLLSFLLPSGQSFGWMYLWQANNDGDLSCCLHIGGVDICNPHVRCTQYIKHDLTGILDYVMRLSSTDKALASPHSTILTQAKRYIRAALGNPYYSIEYRLSEHRAVRFYHEIIDEMAKQKDGKGPSKAKAKQDQFVKQYLMKLGFAKKRSR